MSPWVWYESINIVNYCLWTEQPLSSRVNLNALYGLLPSKHPSSLTSAIPCIFRRAQRNLVFHADGSGWSPCRYFPVCSAQRLKSSASVSRTNSGVSTRTQGTLNRPISLSIHSKPSIPPRLICSSNHGMKRCRSFVSLEVPSPCWKDRSSDETRIILDNIFGFLQFRAMSYFLKTTQFRHFWTAFVFLLRTFTASDLIYHARFLCAELWTEDLDEGFFA